MPVGVPERVTVAERVGVVEGGRATKDGDTVTLDVGVLLRLGVWLGVMVDVTLRVCVVECVGVPDLDEVPVRVLLCVGVGV